MMNSLTTKESWGNAIFAPEARITQASQRASEDMSGVIRAGATQWMEGGRPIAGMM